MLRLDLKNKKAYLNGELLPTFPDETDEEKLAFYNYKDGDWIFLEEKYNEFIKKKPEAKLAELKQQKIQQSKRNLDKYLETTTIVSGCHGGIEKKYSITSEKQQNLASMVLTAILAEQSGQAYQPSWNATGEPCTYDWTLTELQQLAMEMEAFVRPLISKQQMMEVSINEASSVEEVEMIDITFGEGE